MPLTLYTEDEYHQLEKRLKRATEQVDSLLLMRPAWAEGYTSDSVAAQVSSGALQTVYKQLGVTNFTDCMLKLEALTKEQP